MRRRPQALHRPGRPTLELWLRARLPILTRCIHGRFHVRRGGLVQTLLARRGCPTLVRSTTRLALQDARPASGRLGRLVRLSKAGIGLARATTTRLCLGLPAAVRKSSPGWWQGFAKALPVLGRPTLAACRLGRCSGIRQGLFLRGSARPRSLDTTILGLTPLWPFAAGKRLRLVGSRQWLAELLAVLGRRLSGAVRLRLPRPQAALALLPRKGFLGLGLVRLPVGLCPGQGLAELSRLASFATRLLAAGQRGVTQWRLAVVERQSLAIHARQGLARLK